VAPIAESHKVILFTQVAESPKITTAGDYVFRISASSVLSAHGMVEGLTKLGLNKVSVIFENAEYTVGMKDAFVKEFTENKANTILATESFGSKDTDLRTQLSILGKSKPQILVVFANSTITANIVTNQLKDLGLKLSILGNSYFGSSPTRENPNNAGNYVVVYKYDTTAPELLKFLADYKNRFGKEPAQNFYAAISYDGYNVIFNAIKECGSDNSECIKKALYGVKDYQGITGKITIDQNGDTMREFNLKKIVKGVLTDVE
jgi:branched-chain amino acid transport system substrate-binding protein